MTAEQVKTRVLAIVARYDRGIYDEHDMRRELHVLAITVDHEEREVSAA